MSLESRPLSLSPSEKVVGEVAAREGVDPTDLVPLYNTIDPAELDRIVDSASETGESDLKIEFSYHDYDVTVTADGDVHIGRLSLADH